jgi:MEDS: MEthanogen/methylotroph, DcmR Sensory domain
METVVAKGTEHPGVGHLVQFYSHDEELADQVAGYLLGALDNGGAAVLIATPAHRRALEARLTREHADLESASGSGAYQALDASETLRELTPAGRLDPASFDRVIGAVMVRAGQAGRPVRAYGEMVSLLWTAGLVNAAVEIEEMWNQLAQRHPFSLLCSYPAASVTGDGQLDEFAALCRLHGSVAGPWPGPAAARGFARCLDAPAAARHFAVDAARRLGAGDLADDVALVVTELAANAIVHAHSGFTVELMAEPDVVRISVCDGSPLPADPDRPALPATPLHGLYAVDALASRWGVEPIGHTGKSVWAELRR